MAARKSTTETGGADGDNIGTEEERCLHETFKEADEVRGLIKNLDGIWQDTIAMETSAERFRGTSEAEKNNELSRVFFFEI